MAAKPIPPRDIPKFIESFKNGVDMLAEKDDNVILNSWTGISNIDRQDKHLSKNTDKITFFIALKFVETHDLKYAEYFSGQEEKFNGIIYGLFLAGYLEENNGELKVSEIGIKKLEDLKKQIPDSME